MDIDITGRGAGITDRFREYVNEKSEKVSQLAERALVLEIKLSRQQRGQSQNAAQDRIELTLVGPGPVVRAEAEASDKYAAFDIALGRLLERVRRAKDRRKIHRGQHRPTSLREASASAFAATDITPVPSEVLQEAQGRAVGATVTNLPATYLEDVEEDVEVYSPVVIRRKTFASHPMSVDDALYYMEMVGHDFYLFIDSATGDPSVVYRRKGWDYGLIALDDSAAELQETATVVRKLSAE